MVKVLRWIFLPYSLLLVLKDSQVPVWAKLRVLAILSAAMAYILSPFNIIPDWIPFLGWIDDLVVLQLAVMFAARVVPESRLDEKAAEAKAGIRRIAIGLVALSFAVLVVLAGSLAGIAYGIYRLIT